MLALDCAIQQTLSNYNVVEDSGIDFVLSLKELTSGEHDGFVNNSWMKSYRC